MFPCVLASDSHLSIWEFILQKFDVHFQFDMAYKVLSFTHIFIYLRLSTKTINNAANYKKLCITCKFAILMKIGNKIVNEGNSIDGKNFLYSIHEGYCPCLCKFLYSITLSNREHVSRFHLILLICDCLTCTLNCPNCLRLGYQYTLILY